jgi:hypothetical protein
MMSAPAALALATQPGSAVVTGWKVMLGPGELVVGVSGGDSPMMATFLWLRGK